jgi:hypothetical protein
MIAKMPKKSREFLESECVRIANGQIEVAVPSALRLKGCL